MGNEAKPPRRRWTAKERADELNARADVLEAKARKLRDKATDIIETERARAQAVLDALPKES